MAKRPLTPTARDIRRKSANFDVDKLVAQIGEMGGVLRDIAIEQQHDKPDVAARAAMGSARAASEILGTLMVRDQLQYLVDEIEVLRTAQEKNGIRSRHYDDDDPSVIRPTWYQPNKNRRKTDETQQDGREGDDEPGATDDTGRENPEDESPEPPQSGNEHPDW